MEIAELIQHPEQMDRDSLYELRSLLALYPYFQTARLLLLQNLFLLHVPTFDEELRRAAVYITDRRVIFQLVEAAHYQPRTHAARQQEQTPATGTASLADGPAPLADSPAPLADSPAPLDTFSLIDDFLDSLPKTDQDDEEPRRRKPTPADATVDYVAYLLATEALDADAPADAAADTPQMKGQQLIDTFINRDKGRITLNPQPTLRPDSDATADDDEKAPDQEVCTETLARIYIKQGNFLRALQIIKQLSLENTKKNVYFADQIRFLEKLIINNNKKQ